MGFDDPATVGLPDQGLENRMVLRALAGANPQPVQVTPDQLELLKRRLGVQAAANPRHIEEARLAGTELAPGEDYDSRAMSGDVQLTPMSEGQRASTLKFGETPPDPDSGPKPKGKKGGAPAAAGSALAGQMKAAGKAPSSLTDADLALLGVGQEMDNGSKALRDAIAEYQGRSKKMDLSPLLALTDAWTGSQLTRGYERPESDADRQAMVTKLKLAFANRKDSEIAQQDAVKQKIADREQREKDKQDEIAMHLKVANINASSRDGKNAEGAQKYNAAMSMKNFKLYAPQLQSIAKVRYGNPENPDDKSYKAKVAVVHQDVQDLADQLVMDKGMRPDQAYLQATQYYMQKPNGRDLSGG
jgi:hypothetical protein